MINERNMEPGGEILTVASGDIGTADTSYIYFDMGRKGYCFFTLQYVITATTLTIEGTNSPETITDANAVWTDITTALTGSATITATGAHIEDTPICFGRLRIKRLTTNATNALRLLLARAS